MKKREFVDAVMLGSRTAASMKRSQSEAIRVAERLILSLLGPAYSVTTVSIENMGNRVERAWLCGCQSTLGAEYADVALWNQCTQHAAFYFKNDAVETHPLRVLTRFRSAFSLNRFRVVGGTALLTALAITTNGIVRANKLLHRAEEAEGAALVDPLTGLYNRRGWDRRIEEERKRLKRDKKLAIAIYMLDVDGLKQSNDEGGHAAGDEILKSVAKVVREVTREHDVAARLGGDEFGILTVQSQAAEADLVRARLERGFHSATVSVSIGFAFAESGDTIERAMDVADSAMYEVKKKNRSPAVRLG